MKALFKHEFFKAFRSRTIWVINLVFGLLMVLNLVAAIAVENIAGAEVAGSIVSSVNGANAAWGMATNSNMFLIISVWVATIVVYDISKQTIKNTLMAGYSRMEVLVVKFVVTAAMLGITYVGLTILSLLAQCAVGSWGEAFTFLSFSRNFIEPFFLGLLVMVAFIGFAFFIAFWTKNTVLVVLCNLILTFIMSILQMIYAVNTMAGDTSPFLEFLFKIYFGTSIGMYMDAPSFVNFIYVVCSALIIFLPIIGAYFIFKKSEIK